MQPHVDLLICPIAELCTPHIEGLARGQDLGQIRRIKNAAIAVGSGIILGAGTSEAVLAEFKPSERTIVVDASDKLVTPGLVDPHTHLIFAGNRANEFIMRCQGKSYAEIARSGGGIVASMEATRGASLDHLVALGSQRLQRMLSCGTTTCEVKTGYGLDCDTELRMLESILVLQGKQPVELVPTFMPAHAFPPGSDQGRYVNEIVDTMLPQAAQRLGGSAPGGEKLMFNDVFCDEGYFSLEQARQILVAGIELGMRPKIHADEFASLGATRLAIELGAASADHLLAVTDADIDLLSKSNTVAVLLPGTSFYLNLAGHAPARRLIDRGAAVALGSDFNPGSCHIFSLPLIWALACLHLKMTPEEALSALTVNAAFAIGLGEKIGQIREGYQADLVVFNVGCLEEIPYNLGWNPVAMTFKRGQLVSC